ncbi:MAG: type II toxin-antitoxin system HicA family toxin [Thermodesulforhabdaceae bacterium]
MTRLPVVDFKTMEQVLLRLGFQAVRQKGSHVFYRHSDGGRPPFQITREGISPVHLSEKSFMISK